MNLYSWLHLSPLIQLCFEFQDKGISDERKALAPWIGVFCLSSWCLCEFQINEHVVYAVQHLLGRMGSGISSDEGHTARPPVSSQFRFWSHAKLYQSAVELDSNFWCNAGVCAKGCPRGFGGVSDRGLSPLQAGANSIWSYTRLAPVLDQ